MPYYYLLYVLIAILYATICAADAPTVAATVNGKPIYTAEVERNLPDAPEAVLKEQNRRERLQRLVNAAIIDQTLEARKVMVSAADVESELEQMRKTPPAQPCGCHSYGTLAEFLRLNGMTEDDLRLEIRRNQALDRMVEAQWVKLHPTEADRQKLVQEQRELIRGQYRKVWQIFTQAILSNDADPDADPTAKAA